MRAEDEDVLFQRPHKYPKPKPPYEPQIPKISFGEACCQLFDTSTCHLLSQLRYKYPLFDL